VEGNNNNNKQQTLIVKNDDWRPEIISQVYLPFRRKRKAAATLWNNTRRAARLTGIGLIIIIWVHSTATPALLFFF
jgi:hypothetical protein